MEYHKPDWSLKNIGAIELTPLKQFDHWKVSMKNLELILNILNILVKTTGVCALSTY